MSSYYYCMITDRLNYRFQALDGRERGRTSGESGGLLVAQLHGNRGLEAMEKRSCWRARANESEVLRGKGELLPTTRVFPSDRALGARTAVRSASSRVKVPREGETTGEKRGIERDDFG